MESIQTTLFEPETEESGEGGVQEQLVPEPQTTPELHESVLRDIEEYEYRTIGPPGCGKTTWLSTQVQHSVSQYGYDKVVVASLTRVAAAEVAGRLLPIPESHIGTLHAHARRALGTSELAQSPRSLAGWNEANPGLTLSGGTTHDEMDAVLDGQWLTDTAADDLFARMQILRSRDIDPENWPTTVLDFYHLWTAWKRENDLIDFTDMLELAYTDTDAAPGNPAVIMIDEAQDLDKLGMKLVRHWGQAAEKLIVVGDPDQCLYDWRGSDPEAFTTPALPSDHRRVLKQSHRVPAAVHREAVKWIEGIQGREPIEYYPRRENGETVEGFLKRCGGNWKIPQGVVGAAEEYLNEGKTVMFLTSCGYMLRPLVSELRRQGIAYHNPYRFRPDWNPLVRGKGGRITALDRIFALLRWDADVWGHAARSWTWNDVFRFGDALEAKSVFRRGGKTIIKKRKGDHEEAPLDVLVNEVFYEDAMDHLFGGDLRWYQSHLTGRAKALEFPLDIAIGGGIEALTANPKVIVGTIHGVKGGEADVVFLFPDISLEGWRGWTTTGGLHNAIRRQFYVGMTRAREGLIFVDPASSMSLNL